MLVPNVPALPHPTVVHAILTLIALAQAFVGTRTLSATVLAEI
jgi:hypothetical protein